MSDLSDSNTPLERNTSESSFEQLLRYPCPALTVEDDPAPLAYAHNQEQTLCKLPAEIGVSIASNLIGDCPSWIYTYDRDQALDCEAVHSIYDSCHHLRDTVMTSLRDAALEAPYLHCCNSGPPEGSSIFSDSLLRIGIEEYLLILGKRPALRKKVHSLRVRIDTKEGRNCQSTDPSRERACGRLTDEKLKALLKWADIRGMSEERKKLWKKDLVAGSCLALVGWILFMLPNLRTLVLDLADHRDDPLAVPVSVFDFWGGAASNEHGNRPLTNEAYMSSLKCFGFPYLESLRVEAGSTMSDVLRLAKLCPRLKTLELIPRGPNTLSLGDAIHLQHVQGYLNHIHHLILNFRHMHSDHVPRTFDRLFQIGHSDAWKQIFRSYMELFNARTVYSPLGMSPHAKHIRMMHVYLDNGIKKRKFVNAVIRQLIIRPSVPLAICLIGGESVGKLGKNCCGVGNWCKECAQLGLPKFYNMAQEDRPSWSTIESIIDGSEYIGASH